MDLEKLKHKSLMKEFNLYKEMAQKPRARIKEVRVEALREGFKRMIHLKNTEPFASKKPNCLRDRKCFCIFAPRQSWSQEKIDTYNKYRIEESFLANNPTLNEDYHFSNHFYFEFIE